MQHKQAAQHVAGKGPSVSFWLFGLSGMAALIYEVVWTRALSLVLGGTTYALSTMLASFMAGLSLGAFFGGRMADRSKNAILLFALLETGIAVSGLMAIPLINLLPTVYLKFYYAFNSSFSSFSIFQFIICFMVMLVPTTLMGATFPVVCTINYRDGQHIGRETGGIYAINTVGSIAGALIAGFFLIPNLGVRYSNLFAAFLNISVASILFYAYFAGTERWRKMTGVVSLVAVAFLCSQLIWSKHAYPVNFYTAYKFESYEAYRIFLNEYSGLYKKVYEKENIQGNVKVFALPDGEKTIFVNGRPESNTSQDLLNTTLLAYLPASVVPDAESFLSIGLGTGNTIRSALMLPQMNEVHSVEINPAVEEAVRLHFSPDIFKDKRARFITADARNYLTLAGRKYDIISSEPSYPVDQGFSHLFSIEFFDLVKRKLNENGAFCQWVPTYLFSEDEMAMILKTFAKVFPNTTVWGVNDSEILFIGYVSDRPQFTDAMKTRTNRLLASRGINPDYSLYVSGEEVQQVVKSYSGRINTDDLPLLEFYASRNMLTKRHRP